MSPRSPFELKSGSYTFPTLLLLGADLVAFEAELDRRMALAPDFFHHAPVVVDLARLPEDAADLDLAALTALLRDKGMQPLGIRGGAEWQRVAAEALGLAILADPSRRPAPTTEPPLDVTQFPAPEPVQESAPMPEAAPEPEPAPAPEPPTAAPAADNSGELMVVPAVAKFVTRPVRSGQKVYAAGGDLVVTAAVSAGAELMADGNIHVYGPLRGRAMAGVRGNRAARIYCSALGAELVSVAGNYRLSDGFEPGLVGQQVQVRLDGEKLLIEPIGA